jgi:hypothetical protein
LSSSAQNAVPRYLFYEKNFFFFGIISVEAAVKSEILKILAKYSGGHLMVF